jgi:hypothetical protein
MTKWIIALIAALAVTAPMAGYAQDNASSPAPTVRQLALAHELVEISGARNLVTTLFTTMLNQLVAGSDPHATSAQDRKVRDIMLASAHVAFEKAMPKMLDLFVDTYAHDFSEQELSDIVAFYKTPSGQAAIAKLPKVMAETMPAVRNTIVPQMQQDMIDEMCNRLACTSSMRAAIQDRLRGAQH